MGNEENKKTTTETQENDSLSVESMDMNEGQTLNGTIGGTGSNLDALEKREEDNKPTNGLQKDDKS